MLVLGNGFRKIRVGGGLFGEIKCGSPVMMPFQRRLQILRVMFGGSDIQLCRYGLLRDDYHIQVASS